LIALSPRAEQQLEALRRHYESLGRVESLHNLLAAVGLAAEMIAQIRKRDFRLLDPIPKWRNKGAHG
jgi:hypothetical protein